MEDTEVKYTLILEGIDRLEHGMQSSKHHTDALGESMGHLKEMAIELIGVYAGFEVLKESLEVYKQHSEAVMKLTAMYENNKSTVHETVEQLEVFANQQEKITGIYQENYMAAEANLMKFRDLKVSMEDILPIAADYAKLTGTDIADAANLMGRALAHPEMAARLLRQAGIALNSTQLNMIEHLQRTGKGAEVQAKLFDLLKDKFQGVAAAMFESHPLEKLQLGFREVKVSIGEFLEKGLMIITPYLLKLMQDVKEVVHWMEEHATIVKVVVGVITTLVGLYAAYSLGVKLAAAYTAIFEVAQWALNAALTANPIGLIVMAIAALSVGMYELYQHFEGFRRVTNTVWAGLKDLGLAIYHFAIFPFKELYHTAAAVWDVLTGDFSGAKSNLSKIVDDAVEGFKDLKKGIVDVREAWDADYSKKEEKKSPLEKIGAGKMGKGIDDKTLFGGADNSDKVTGTKQVIINVSINKLVEMIKIQAANIKEGANSAGEDVAKALLGAVDQFGASADI